MIQGVGSVSLPLTAPGSLKTLPDTLQDNAQWNSRILPLPDPVELLGGQKKRRAPQLDKNLRDRPVVSASPVQPFLIRHQYLFILPATALNQLTFLS